jgi:hypothetical protein
MTSANAIAFCQTSNFSKLNIGEQRAERTINNQLMISLPTLNHRFPSGFTVHVAATLPAPFSTISYL